jgi:hypothetical protein
MRHTFSGDPWGPCSLCDHPVYHPIHMEGGESMSETESETPTPEEGSDATTPEPEGGESTEAEDE